MDVDDAAMTDVIGRHILALGIVVSLQVVAKLVGVMVKLVMNPFNFGPHRHYAIVAQEFTTAYFTVSIGGKYMCTLQTHNRSLEIVDLGFILLLVVFLLLHTLVGTCEASDLAFIFFRDCSANWNG